MKHGTTFFLFTVWSALAGWIAFQLGADYGTKYSSPESEVKLPCSVWVHGNRSDREVIQWVLDSWCKGESK